MTDKVLYLYTLAPFYLAYIVGFTYRAILFAASAVVAGYRQGRGDELGWGDIVFVGIVIVGGMIWIL